MEKQKTFAGEYVKTQDLSSDLVECEDLEGLERLQERGDCWRVEIPSIVFSNETLDKETKEGLHNDIEVLLVDSLKAGNCKEGSLETHKIGLQGKSPVLIGDLLKLCESLTRLSPRIYSTIRQALIRTGRHKKETRREYFYSYLKSEQRKEEVLEEIEDHNRQVFSSFFQAMQDSKEEYCKSDDYAGEYSYLMSEGDNIVDNLERILTDEKENLGISYRASLPKDFIGDLAAMVLSDNLFTNEVSEEYESTPNYYLDGFRVGEEEDQIDLAEIYNQTNDALCFETPEGEDRGFNEILLEYLQDQRDYCIHFKDLIREKENRYKSVTLITDMGIRIDFVTSLEDLETATTNLMLETCRKLDYRRKEKLEEKAESLARQIEKVQIEDQSLRL